MKKIMFNDRFGLESAVFNGSKTMTRRAVKFPKTVRGKDWGYYHYPIGPVTRPGFHACVELLDCDEFHFEPEAYICSQYAVGDVVAIAQSYEQLEKEAKAKGSQYLVGDKLTKVPGYKNKMYVKAEYMPHHIGIKSVRVQKLQAISDEDCLREGVYYDKEGGRSIGTPFAVPFYYTFKGAIGKNGKQLHWATPKKAFMELIDKTCGKGTWESNPLVYAYTYELID